MVNHLTQKLLTRDEFRKIIFASNDGKCVVCKQPAVDAHHIIERGLWKAEHEREGYFIQNGAALCEIHHKLAEKNVLCPQVIRTYAGITERIIPGHLDQGEDYNKWGVPFKMPTRLDIKYPSTWYFQFSPGKHFSEDEEFLDIDKLIDVPLVMTIKMDGSNAKVTNGYVGARNGTMANHSSFSLLKAEHAEFK